MISILMSAYNTENFISATIKSILMQDYTDWELIIINDSSTDKTLQIINSFKDSRIHVFTIPHSGHSVCKYHAFQHSNGEYILFFDSDDIMHPQLLSTLLYTSINTGSDISVCRFMKFSDQTLDLSPQTIGSPIIFNQSRMTLIFTPGISHALWNKLFKRCVFNNFKFPFIDPCSDTPTCYKLIEKGNKVALVHNTLVYYRQRVGSITYNRKVQIDKYAIFRFMLWIDAFKELWDTWPQSRDIYIDFLRRETENLKTWQLYDELEQPTVLWLQQKGVI